MTKLEFEELEKVKGQSYNLSRVKVSGGWIVRETIYANVALVFVPDPQHNWN